MPFGIEKAISFSAYLYLSRIGEKKINSRKSDVF